MALWRSGYAAVCKTAYTGSIPVGASKSKAPPIFRWQRLCWLSVTNQNK